MKIILTNNSSFLLLSFLLAISFSLFAFNPLIPVVILFLALIFYSNKIIRLGLIIIIYLSITTEFFENIRGYVNVLAALLLFILFLKEYGLRVEKYPKIPKILLAFLSLLFFTLTISTIFSQNVIISAIATIRTLLFICISYLFYSFLSDQKNIKGYIYAIFVVVFVIGIPMIIDLYYVGIQNYFIRVLLTDKFDLITSRGYTGFTILFFSISLITAMFFMSDYKNIIAKVILIFLLIFNIAVLILANSRGGILAAIISVSYILYKLKRFLFIKTVLFVSAVLVLILLVVPTISEALDFYMRWKTVSEREVYWQMGLDVINDSPIIGIGPDLFDKNFFNYAPSKTINHFKPDFLMLGKPHPHNFFLYYTAENGILGLITSITFFIVFFYIAFKTKRLLEKFHRDYYTLTIAIIGIGIGLFIRSFIEVTGFLQYGYITLDLPFWIIFGILISIYQKSLEFNFLKLQTEKLD